MSNLYHIVLYILLFSTFYSITRLNQNSINKRYWGITTIPILLYAFITGCRYGWGPDYIAYKHRIEHPFNYSDEDFGFRWINATLQECGFNYVGVYIIYSLIFIIGAYVLIRYYRNNKYMLALFLPSALTLITSTIRQGLAHSFIFIALYFLMKRKWIGVISMVIVAYCIHPSSLITLFLCCGIYVFVHLINSKLPPVYILIGIYVTATLGSMAMSSTLTPLLEQYISVLSLGESKFQNYVDNSDMWFGEVALNDAYEQSTFAFILSMLFHTGIIYLGYIALKYRLNLKVLYIYYSVFIGMVVLKLFFTIELMRRIAMPFEQMYFIPLGYALSFYFKCSKYLTKQERQYALLSGTFVIGYLVLFYGRFILQSPGRIFFWNLNH